MPEYAVRRAVWRGDVVARAGRLDWPELLARWKPLCDRLRLDSGGAKSTDPPVGCRRESALIDRLLVESPGRTKSIRPGGRDGQEAGGSLAFLAAFRNREAIRAVAAVEAATAGPPPENDPLHRLAIYMATAGKSASPGGRMAVAAFRTLKVPVIAKDLGDVAFSQC